MKKFFILLGAVMFLALARLDAQIVVGTVGQGSFTDWSGSTSSRFGLDFNNDGVLEFVLKDAEASVSATRCALEWSYSDNGNNVWTAGDLNQGGWDEILAISANASISSSGNWEGQGDAYLVNYYDEVVVPVNQDFYVGFRVKVNGSTHYGWARVKLTGNANSGYTADWQQIAYNSTPNAPISAGQTGNVGIKEHQISGITIYPNPVQNILIIDGLEQVANVTIYDMYGNMMFTESMVEDKINVANFPAGVYVAVVESATGMKTMKFVKR